MLTHSNYALFLYKINLLFYKNTNLTPCISYPSLQTQNTDIIHLTTIAQLIPFLGYYILFEQISVITNKYYQTIRFFS